MSDDKNISLYEIIYKNGINENNMVYNDDNIIYKSLNDIRTENIKTSSICKNNINLSSYNYKLGDKYLNKILDDNKNIIYKIITKNFNSIDIPKNFDDTLMNDLKHSLNMPYMTVVDETKYKLFFDTKNNSTTFSKNLVNYEKTEFILEEQFDINKNDHAYVTLFFPTYNNNGTKKYGFLPSILLIGHMLKYNVQNYDLYIKGKIGTKASVICMVTPDVDEYIIDILKIYYDDVITCPYITWSNINLPKSIINDKNRCINITDVSKGNIKPNHSYNKVMTKLNIFNKTLFNYKKIVFVDGDLYPLGFYDTLFSLDVPAGWLEHKRMQSVNLGVDSWATDRGLFAKHGSLIPNLFTDIDKCYGSDINASLLVIEPNNELYNEMITELQEPIDQIFGDVHKGIWLGDRFYDFYYLPEQNYLTKKFSGQWHSIDMGFSTWLLDVDKCFGFTFAGFIVKPWEYQSSNHKYSINPYSVFSKINNKLSQKSFGYQLLNNYMAKMLYKIKNNEPAFNVITNYCNTKILQQSFDPWEPEYLIDKHDSISLKNINVGNENILSYDQKKLSYLMRTKTNNTVVYKKYLYGYYLFEQFCPHIYDIHFLTLSCFLIEKMCNVINNLKLSDYLFPFGNTFLSLHRFSFIDVTDDDNDFVVILKKKDYVHTIKKMIELFLGMNLQVFICTLNNDYIQVLRNDIKPLYYYKKQNNKYMLFSDLDKFNFKLFKYFNISYYYPQLEHFLNDKQHVNTSSDIHTSYNNNNIQYKTPWVDIFVLLDDGTSKLNFLANNNVKLSKNIFIRDGVFNFCKKTINVKLLGRKINLQLVDRFIEEYYKDPNKLKKFVIKTKHSMINSMDGQRKVVFETDYENLLSCNMIKYISKTIYKNIKSIYDSTNIDTYLGL